MITGHNTDINHNGVIYHVQTEDKGKSNPVVETLVYRGGEILDARRTSYEELLSDGYEESKIISLIEEQHRSVIGDIKGGKYETATGQTDLLGEQIIDSRKSLDQVILEYLAAEDKKDRLMIEVQSSAGFTEGAQITLAICAKNSATGAALKGVKVVVKIISTIKKPLTIHEGKTDRNGMAAVKFVMPEFPDGTAAMLIQAFSDYGSDEIKVAVEKRKRA
jgi:hypothetical protein